MKTTLEIFEREKERQRNRDRENIIRDMAERLEEIT